MCAAASGAEDAPKPSGLVARTKSFFNKWVRAPAVAMAPHPHHAGAPSQGGFDKAKLKTLGVDAFFTYGVVSNINAGFTVALAWGTFSKASGLSPFAPGQWKAFLVTYAGIYATIGSILRPIRFAIAVSFTPLYSRLISRVRDSLPFRSTRPALNRTLSLVLVSLVLNVAGARAPNGPLSPARPFPYPSKRGRRHRSGA